MSTIGNPSAFTKRCDTCHPGAAQGPNRHDSCTHQPTSRRQFHERYLPSLAVEPQLLPDSAESLVLNVNTSPTQVSTKPAPVSLFEDCPGTPLE